MGMPLHGSFGGGSQVFEITGASFDHGDFGCVRRRNPLEETVRIAGAGTGLVEVVGNVRGLLSLCLSVYGEPWLVFTHSHLHL